MYACAGAKLGRCLDGARVVLPRSQLSTLLGLCEMLKGQTGMRACLERLGQCTPCIFMLQVCIVDLLLPINRMQPLAKALEHAEIRLLRQLRRSTDFALAAFLPCAHAHDATS